MKKFIVRISAYDYFAKFEVESKDDPISLEQAILDKLGENSIVWEYTGDMYDTRRHRITYEEVINDATTSTGPLQTKEVSGTRMGAGAS
tara:strand:- start:276 stop:542 length:267 start_codon:yes stop_codon:yes gene_type:complete